MRPSPAAWAATSDDPAWPDDAVEVGRIVGAWGLKGWVKVQPFASDPQALFSSRRWFIKPPEEGAVKRPVASTATAAALPMFLKVTEAKDHGDAVVALGSAGAVCVAAPLPCAVALSLFAD